MLTDSFDRKIDYVRISLTDRCNLRCIYCMPENGIKKLQHNEILSYEEIERIIKILRELGIKKFRFTGGEPFIRKGVIDFLEKLNLEEYYITTNLAVEGLEIERINNLNLAGINVSCDSLKPDRYRYITRGGRLNIFLDNFKKLNIKNLKLNVVIIKNFNEDEIIDFIEFGIRYNATVRFIEKMDIINDNLEYVSVQNIKKRLISQNIIEPQSMRNGNAVAEYFCLKNNNGKVGFISPISKPFCNYCNKIRIKANGDIKLCLFDENSFNIKKILQKEKSDEKVKQWLKEIIINKKPYQRKRYLRSSETMSEVGG